MVKDQKCRECDRDEAEGSAQDETQGVESDAAIPEGNFGDCSTCRSASSLCTIARQENSSPRSVLLTSSRVVLHVVHDAENLGWRRCIFADGEREIIERKGGVSPPGAQELLSYPPWLHKFSSGRQRS